MTIKTNLDDRKELAKRLIPFNHNEKLHYAGTPTFAFEGHNFRILRSLIFTMSTQQYLLNRAAGSENFHITEDCVTALKEAALTDAASFFKVYGACQNGNKGIRLNEESATFCFADTGNAVKNRAMVELFAFLISAARKAKRVQPAVKKPENEKYYFRSWLLRIGMGTKASHESRMALMKDLNGWSAFRTEEEAKRHAERVKAHRNR